MAIKEYFVDGYLLRVYDSGYLVRVKPAGMTLMNEVGEIPDWVFRSSHAIWLTEGSSPLPVRARQGDEIKHQILRRKIQPSLEHHRVA